MAKLCCDKHGSRVLVIPTDNRSKPKVIHRSGGEACDSRMLTIRGRKLSPDEVTNPFTLTRVKMS